VEDNLEKRSISPFIFDLPELSGALADLGVMLPLVLALITLNGMDAGAVFIGIGIAYIFVAFVYKLPIPIQPLKSISSLALALGLSPALIVTGAIWNAFCFLGLAISGADRWISKAFPKPVIRGIQMALSWLLFIAAWKLISGNQIIWEGGITILKQEIEWTWILASGAVIILAFLIIYLKEYAALGIVVFGIVISIARFGFPDLHIQISSPKLFSLVPSWDQMWRGLILLAIPQIPLSLGNSIYATADAARRYYGNRSEPVTERKLMVTMGLIDGLTAVLGGVPLCHGSGGVTAHYRFGARSGGAPLMLGVGFLFLGFFGARSSQALLSMIPFPVLGIMLIYVGIQHLLLARDLNGLKEWLPALLVVLISVLTGNLALGFMTGALIFHIWSWSSQKLAYQTPGL
jgi:SulP family sulfate permease